MFKESGPKNNVENFEKSRNVDWNSLDLKKIKEQLFKYSEESQKKKLNLIKDEEWKDGHHQIYCNADGRVSRVEKGSSSDADEDNNYNHNDSLQKEYAYDQNGSIDSIQYSKSNSGNNYVGQIQFEYSFGKITKAYVREVAQGFEELDEAKKYKLGKDINFSIDYDSEETIQQVQKEEKVFGNSELKKEILYDKKRDKDKNLVFARMNAAEIVEWDLTRSNDMELKK